VSEFRHQNYIEDAKLKQFLYCVAYQNYKFRVIKKYSILQVGILFEMLDFLKIWLSFQLFNFWNVSSKMKNIKVLNEDFFEKKNQTHNFFFWTFLLDFITDFYVVANSFFIFYIRFLRCWKIILNLDNTDRNNLTRKIGSWGFLRISIF